MSTKNNNHSGYIIFNIQNVDNYSTVHNSVADPDPDPYIFFEDPDPPSGCLGSGSGSIRYSHEDNKINWKRELNKE